MNNVWKWGVNGEFSDEFVETNEPDVYLLEQCDFEIYGVCNVKYILKIKYDFGIFLQSYVNLFWNNWTLKILC